MQAQISVEIEGINYELDGETKEATVIAKSGGEYSGIIVIPESVEHETVTYSVTGIGSQAFFSCSSLESVAIGNSVMSIGDYAFFECVDLESVTIGNSVESIGQAAFTRCSGLTSVTIPNSVMSIGDYAFSECVDLESVTIGNSVESIGQAALSHCPNLTSIVVDVNNANYDSREDCNALIRKSDNTLLSGCRNTVIHNSVESIGDYAFSGCTDMPSVSIPNSVVSIGERAFCYMYLEALNNQNYSEITKYKPLIINTF